MGRKSRWLRILHITWWFLIYYIGPRKLYSLIRSSLVARTSNTVCKLESFGCKADWFVLWPLDLPWFSWVWWWSLSILSWLGIPKRICIIIIISTKIHQRVGGPPNKWKKNISVMLWLFAQCVVPEEFSRIKWPQQEKFFLFDSS